MIGSFSFLLAPLGWLVDRRRLIVKYFFYQKSIWFQCSVAAPLKLMLMHNSHGDVEDLCCQGISKSCRETREWMDHVESDRDIWITFSTSMLGYCKVGSWVEKATPACASAAKTTTGMPSSKASIDKMDRCRACSTKIRLQALARRLSLVAQPWVASTISCCSTISSPFADGPN